MLVRSRAGVSGKKGTLHTVKRRESMNFILWLIIGGILLLAIVNFFRRGTVR